VSGILFPGKAGKHCRSAPVVSRVRSNAAAFMPAPPLEKRSRGRPKIHRRKLRLRSIFTIVKWKVRSFCLPVFPRRVLLDRQAAEGG
jgi:hypothetical protein